LERGLEQRSLPGYRRIRRRKAANDGAGAATEAETSAKAEGEDMFARAGVAAE
jgi:hypothetical protein